MVFNSQPVASAAAYSEKVWSVDDQLCILPVGNAMADLDLVLPRGDRRRLAGLSDLVDSEDEEDTGSSDKENERESEAQLSSDRDRPAKRVRFQGVVDESTEPPLDMIHDDSGVFMDDDCFAKPGNDECSSFTQLAFEAEGFNGPTADGNPFPDMHPIYFDEYNFDMSPRQYALDPYAEVVVAPIPSPLDLLADRRAIQTEVVEDTAAECGLLPPEPSKDAVKLTDALSMPSVVTPIFPETLARLSPHQDTAADVVMRTGTEDPGTSETIAAVSALPAPSARQSLEQFLTICGKGSLVQASAAAPTSSQIESHPEPVLSGPDARGLKITARETPEELLDERTLFLPYDYEPPATAHRYMASMTTIQKRALIRTLGTYWAVDLVEREPQSEDADEVNIIIDCETAVLFFSIEMLPSGGDALGALLTRLSWRYTRLLVIFECYPSVWDYRADREFSHKPLASAWSPPVVKAVRKLRRDLSISEGIQTKSAATVVEYAFANDVEEAAAFTRLYGDAAEARDSTGGMIWGERLWLTHEERDVGGFSL